VVELLEVSKSFGERQVVREVSFSAEAGEVLGLVGPNGAGKTTTIRMILDIIKPDSGTIRVFGRPLTEEAKERIGYLPEERGLYRGLGVWETLLYLASLKGMDRWKAMERAQGLLEAVGMLPHKYKRVQELSRGMGQLVQFVATILHRPQLVIFDEPFAALDPVNVKLIKDMVRDLRRDGTTVILSTHQMNQVEELCDRVVMIDKGVVVLYGGLREIKQRFSANSVLISCDGLPQGLGGIRSLRDRGDCLELFLEEGVKPQELLRRLLERGVAVERFEVALPSLEEIFIRVATAG